MPIQPCPVSFTLNEVAATVLGAGNWEVPDPELLRTQPLFVTIAGESASVRDIAAELEQRGDVLFVELAPEERVDERMILILDDLELAALFCLDLHTYVRSN